MSPLLLARVHPDTVSNKHPARSDTKGDEKAQQGIRKATGEPGGPGPGAKLKLWPRPEISGAPLPNGLAICPVGPSGVQAGPPGFFSLTQGQPLGPRVFGRPGKKAGRGPGPKGPELNPSFYSCAKKRVW